ncbi:MAG TPA: efflux RND transporter periplasmic adaptor subunit [Acidobacteriota bacterium]|nr:efflux RND transporter periplasmic adaptor subunit [Acidobacteriota bacterium]
MSKPRWYRSKYLWLFIIVLIGCGVFAAQQFLASKTDKTSYIFGAVDRGSIVMQVQMTGTLAAVTTVAVGTQVSGTVSQLYADFNSEVKKNQVLAKLDPALFQTQLDQASASVKTSEAILNNDAATIATTKANIEKAKVDVLNSTRKYKMIKELFDEGLETKDDMDSAQATLDSSKASLEAVQSQLTAAQAALKADQARLDQAQANFKNAEVNLEHTIITSPISGTVISRNVDLGQTVAASFSTPTMFTIGEDLTKMQVITNTDEADVGKLKAGMDATFTVDAYTGETFHGKIRQVRLAATTVQNVVTYNAVIDVPNPDMRLKPGMTANVKIEIERADNILRVPNAAIRFKPTLSDTEMAKAFQRAGEDRFYSFYKNQGSQGQGGNQARSQSARAGGTATGSRGSGEGQTARSGQSSSGVSYRGRRTPVWIMGEDKLLRPVVLRLGLTDGVQTQIVDGKLKEGDKIILSAEVAGSTASSTTTRAPGFGGMMGGRGAR